MDLWCNLAIKLSAEQLTFIAERVETPDDRLKDENLSMTELKEKVYCNFTLLRNQAVFSLNFEDWKAYLDRRWEHFVHMGGRYNPVGPAFHQWRNLYGSAKNARSKSVVVFSIACMKYCSTAITSAKQIMRSLAEKADAFDAAVQAAHARRDEITETTKDASAKIEGVRKSISELTKKLHRTAYNFPKPPVMPDFPDKADEMRSDIPYPVHDYNPMENPGKVDDQLADLRQGDKLSIIVAMLNAQQGKLDAAIYHKCNQHLSDKKGMKMGDKVPELESFLPKLQGTGEDRADALPALIGAPIGKLQSRLQKRKKELDRYNVS